MADIGPLCFRAFREQPIWNQSCLAVRAGKMGLVSSPLGISRVIPARKSFLNHCIDQYWPSLIGQDGGYWTSLFYGLSPPLNPPPPHPLHRKKLANISSHVAWTSFVKNARNFMRRACSCVWRDLYARIFGERTETEHLLCETCKSPRVTKWTGRFFYKC